MEIATTTHIKASPEAVFACFTDFKNMEERLESVTDITFLEGDGEPKVGMKWRETRVLFGKEATEEMWITEITRPEEYVVEAASHGMKYRSTYTFVPRDGGTDVTFTFAGTPQTFTARIASRFLFPVFKNVTKKALQSDIDSLKAYLENKSE